MFIGQDYSTTILFCIITMLCWGSWANKQKLAEKTWRFELFYRDYVQQADTSNISSAFIGCIIFNAANILFSAAIALLLIK